MVLTLPCRTKQSLLRSFVRSSVLPGPCEPAAEVREISAARRPGAISAERLSLWLSWPSIVGEFSPGAPWAASVDHPSEEPWPRPSCSLSNLRAAFRTSVEGCVEQHQTVAVSVSGGIDSLAVLVTAEELVRRQGREVVAVMAEMTDDLGVSNVSVVRDLINGLGLKCKVIVVTADERPSGEPAWDPRGPRLDALPEVNRLLAERAADVGASVLLAGNGADELLGTVRYIFTHLLRSASPSALRSFWRDSVRVDRRALSLEFLGVASRLLPRSWRAATYFASSWPELCEARVPSVVGIEFRQHIKQWTTGWIRQMLEFHRAHSSWAEMDAWDALYPLHPLSSPGPIPLRNPFLEEPFFGIATSLPLEKRYEPSFKHAYWRQKSHVIRLCPLEALAYLPTAKQTYGEDLTRRQLNLARDATLLAEYGLVDLDELKRTNDPMLVSRVNATEVWLRHALSRRHCLLN